VGKFDFVFDAKLTRQLEKLSNFDEIAEEMLTEAVLILARCVKRSIGKFGTDEGYLLSSIRTQKKPEKNEYGWYTSVIPTGKDDHGVWNMQKLMILEYGTRYIKPRSILSNAVNNAREEVNEKMMEVMERYTK
jgi:HK97 gp10 family phage protein